MGLLLDKEDKMIIAVDFDGTLAEVDYPFIVKANDRLIAFLKVFQEMGNIVILNTCRHDDELMEAIDFCAEQGLIFDYINENVPELIDKYGDCRKIAADIYVDDKALDLNRLLGSIDMLKGENTTKSEEKTNEKLASEST